MNEFIVFIGDQNGNYLESLIDITQDLETFRINSVLGDDLEYNTLNGIKGMSLRMRFNYHIKAYRLSTEFTEKELYDLLTLNDNLLNYIKTNYEPIRL